MCTMHQVAIFKYTGKTQKQNPEPTHNSLSFSFLSEKCNKGRTTSSSALENKECKGKLHDKDNILNSSY